MRLFWIGALLATLIGCAPPHAVGRVALAAPFEGRQRSLGYDAFPAMRVALRAAIPSLPVDFVAFNDDADPERAARVAANIARDPAVLVVIGHGLLSTTLAALPIYAAAGLPVLVIGASPDQLPFGPGIFVLSPSRATLEACAARVGRSCAEGIEPRDSPPARAALRGFSDISGGPPPTRRSVVAYDATLVALAAIQAAVLDGPPTRSSVTAALSRMRAQGLLGEISFSDTGRWVAAPATPLDP